MILRPLRPGARRRRAGGVRAGLRYAASRQQLWLPLVMMALVGLLAFDSRSSCPCWQARRSRSNGGTYGLLSTMLSVGSVAGSLGVGFIHHPRRQYLMTAALAFATFLAATAGAPDVAVACLTLLATGAAAFSFVTLCSTTLQLHSSPAYRGRIMALWVYVYIGTTPVGSIITGAIISAAGVRAALLTGARGMPGRGRHRLPGAHPTACGRGADRSRRCLASIRRLTGDRPSEPVLNSLIF